MNENDKINYVEFPCRDIAATKAFFQAAFGWSFEDYGPEYTAFSNQGLDGGFFKSDQASLVDNGAALIVLYSDSLEATQGRVQTAGGTISRSIFDFPGGRRFHFTEPSGNELAVWSDNAASAKYT
jgi:predicted enzyme related to lactoylglutathione lyase